MCAGMFTVCVLGFENYESLLRRCLGSIKVNLPSPHVTDVRVGLNAPTSELSAYAIRWCDKIESVTSRADILFTAGPRAPKYPMMRRLFYETPLTTEYVVWFDDDSFLRSSEQSNFFGQLAEVVAGADLIGPSYSVGLRPGQIHWIRRQPWYAARPFPLGSDGRNVVRFKQGGWWVARVASLQQWDYPWPELDHNGGDVMLGALAYQQNWKTVDFRAGVAANADLAGVESEGERRGLNTLPIGATA